MTFAWRTAGVVGIWLAMAGTAHATVTWETPRAVSGPSASLPDLSVAPSGEAILGWATKLDDGTSLPGYTVRPAGGVFGSAATLPSPGSRRTVVALADTGAAAVLSGPPDQGRVALRPPGAAGFGPLVEVNHVVETLAVRRDGHAVLAWSDTEFYGGPDRLWTAWVAPDGSVSAPQKIAEHGDVRFPVGLTFDGTGAAVLVWSAATGPASVQGAGAASAVFATTRAPAGEHFGEPQNISGSFDYNGSASPALQLVTNRAGDVMAVWPQSEPSPYPGTLSMSSRFFSSARPSASSFAAPQGLPPYIGFEWSAALSDQGAGLVAWSDAIGVLTAYAAPGQAWGAPEQATPHAPLTPLAVQDCMGRFPVAGFDAAGNAVVAYAGECGSRPVRRGVFAMYRTRLGRFGAPVKVADAKSVITPQLGLSAAGDGVMTWSEQQNFQQRNVGEEKVFVAEFAAAPPALTRVKAGRTAIAFRVSEPAKLKLSLRARGQRRATVTTVATSGKGRVQLPKRFRRTAYSATLTATDIAGTRSPAARAAYRR